MANINKSISGLLQKHPSVMRTAEAKRVIRMYNRVAQVLMEFEILYHRAWMRSLEAMHEGV